MVKWDSYPNTDCQVTMSGAAESDLEVVTQIPKYKEPTVPGMYLLQRGTSNPELAIITMDHNGLCVRAGIGVFYLDSDTSSRITSWWGPIELD